MTYVCTSAPSLQTIPAPNDECVKWRGFIGLRNVKIPEMHPDYYLFEFFFDNTIAVLATLPALIMLQIKSDLYLSEK